MKEEEQAALLELEQGVRQMVVAKMHLSEQGASWATPILVKLDALRATSPAPAPPVVPGLERPGSGVLNVFTVGPDSPRGRVLTWALNECARVNALPSRVNPRMYWDKAAPGVVLSAAEIAQKSWCGGFCLCAVKEAGFGARTRWDFFGKGFGSAIFVTSSPEPGDIAYFDQPNQHYALIEAVSDDMLWLINGNSRGKGIARNVVKRSSATCYSIERMLADPFTKGTP